MISNFAINPQSGTIEDSRNISLKINYWTEEGDVRVRIENVANKENVTFLSDNSEYLYLNKDKLAEEIKLNLNIPSHSSQSAISLFVFLEKKEAEEYKVFDIQPLVYNLKEESIDFPGDLNISPAFVGPKDSFRVSVDSKGNDKYIFSINDKRYIVLTNEKGAGSLNIKGNDFLDRKEDEESIKRFPVYYYSNESNYTQKIFSGIHVHYLPAGIKAAADEQVTVDPRCTIISETGWVVPEECLEPPEPPEPPGIIPSIPPGPPTKDSECDIDTVTSSVSCRISNSDSTLLPSGLTFHSFVSVDSSVVNRDSNEYNISRVFVSKDDTSLNVRAIAQRDVIVGPKGIAENFSIYVDDDIWNQLDNFDTSSYKIIFNNATFGYQSFDIIEKTTDPYRNLNILVADFGTLGIAIDNFLFCISAIIYKDTPIVPTFSEKLPYIEDTDENPIPVISASIGSNPDFVGVSRDNIVYVVAEAFVNGASQLYFYSFTADHDFYLGDNFGWKQLTENGNNKNPKVVVDTTGTLHVFWESDRSGVYQIYYGVLGPSFISKGNAVLSSILDKHAELLQEEEKPYYYFDGKLLVSAISNEYEVIPKYDTGDLLDDNQWSLHSSDDAVINTTARGNRLEDLNLTVNAFTDNAMAFVSLEQGVLTPNGEYDQYNYEINFNLQTALSQTNGVLYGWDDQTFTEDELDIIYNEWRSKFALEIDDDFSNVPVYTFENNQFNIGRSDNIYDAIIPILGSYGETNPSSASNFEIRFIRDSFSGELSNVRHFVLGVMLEKTVFKAVNSQYPFEYCSETGQTLTDCEGYITEEKHCVYTGKAKMVLLLKNDSIKTSEDDDSEYTLVREFPEEFSIHELHTIKVMVNYAKMYYEDAADYLDQFAHEEFSRFICSIKIIMDEYPIFGESFVTDLSDRYRKFDIGFGVPAGGSYLADKMIPNKLSIYDNIQTTFDFTNVSITSPTLEFDSQIVTVPTQINDQDDLFTYDNNHNDESSSVSFSTNFSLLSMAFDDDRNVFLNPSISEIIDDLFLQVPLTFEGTNMSPSVTLGKCNDVHLVWQSNRGRYWDVYYANSVKKGLPFRLETQITNTESNSIMPSVSVNQNGNRMIVWHDNRNGGFEVFAARSLEGYPCTKEKCKSDLFDSFGEDIETCSLTFYYSATSTGIYHFKIEFYSDNNLNNLFKSISTEKSTTGWKIDGTDFSDLCVTTNSTCDGVSLQAGLQRIVTYDVQNVDGVFDKILYYKLVGIVG
tara:strand:+ start:25614 stop:29348 length:3735 start_codon:yes stop_codon:yes gene_type:complete